MTWKSRSVALVIGLAGWLVGGMGAANAQCEPRWLDGMGVAGVYKVGTQSSVSECFVWDRDGLGPLPAVLIASGVFDVAGDVVVSSIVQYDGESFQSLGSGVDGGVGALGEFGGDLIVGGGFAHAGGQPALGIARWDGVEWSAIGGGITYQSNGEPKAGSVDGIASWNGLLVAVGSFDKAGGQPAANIAVWDGQNWSSVGGGVGKKVFTVAAYQGDLYIGGDFKSAGGQTTKGIARWNGTTWDNLQGGFGAGSYVFDLVVHDGVLHAVGSFGSMGGVSTGGVAVWNGSQWSAFKGTLAPQATALEFPLGVPTLVGSSTKMRQWDGMKWTEIVKSGTIWNMGSIAEFQGSVIVGGTFDSLNGAAAASIARWDGTSFASLQAEGLSTYPSSVLGINEALYVAGGQLWNVEGVPVEGVAKWDGQAWTGVGSGLFGNGETSLGKLGLFQGQLHVTGSFKNLKIGLETINGIARWDGASWRALGAGLTGGFGANPMIEHEGSLVVGGTFQAAGGKPASCIARWDGSQWYPLGSGISIGSVTGPNVFDVASHQGWVVAAGDFLKAGGVGVKNVAAWNGTSWKAMGSGLNSWVSSLQVHEGQLYAGENGFFVNDFGIARWNGAIWEGILVNPDVRVEDLASHRGNLVVAGTFEAIDGVQVNHIARWNGQVWLPIDGGLNYAATRLTSWNDQVVVAGLFSHAGGRLSAFLARATCGCPVDCDSSGSLDIDDFICFQTLYAIGDAGADCDGNGTLDLDDFVCFQSAYAMGC